MIITVIGAQVPIIEGDPVLWLDAAARKGAATVMRDVSSRGAYDADHLIVELSAARGTA